MASSPAPAAAPPLPPPKFLNGDTSYWIVKNSWGPQWGDGGYMYIKMTQGKGVGAMLSTPPVYPVIANGCTPGVCGNGTCVLTSGTDYFCSCSPGFVNVTSVYGPNSRQETCAIVDVCTTSTFNPCGLGLCSNDGEGSYTCNCTAGMELTKTVAGQETCVPESSTSAAPTSNTYVVRPRDTCNSVASLFNLTVFQLTVLNPGIRCRSPLTATSTVAVGPTAVSGCGLLYSIGKMDDCGTISDRFGIDNQTLEYLNPSLNCSALVPGSSVCVEAGNVTVFPKCGQLVTAGPDDSCSSIQAQYAIGDAAVFFALNPGLFCDNLTPGAEVCVRAYTPPQRVRCPYLHMVGAGQTCAYLASAYCNNSLRLFEYLNGNVYVCQNSRIVPGSYVCVLHP